MAATNDRDDDPALVLDELAGTAEQPTTQLAGLTPPPVPVPPAPSAPAPFAAGASRASEPAPRPTVRWGALVWSLLFGATAAIVLWVVTDPLRRERAGDWFAELDPFAAWLYVLIGIGAIVAIFGLVGLIRRGERRRRAASS
ncbi:hypothetical protein ACFVTX_06575 [Agromyces sp. NPDC058136]|uniref:hypothetical protein n=1 Tax=Agromyces sp. NPDC058136 TaxID=3346354 RepID=UPI0036DC46A2